MLPKYIAFDGILDNAPKGKIGRKTPEDASVNKSEKVRRLKSSKRFLKIDSLPAIAAAEPGAGNGVTWCNDEYVKSSRLAIRSGVQSTSQ
jgi:hypothetical protein